MCTEHFDGGLAETGITKTDAQWALLHPVEDGELPHPRITPQTPDVHPANATAAAISLYKIASTRGQSYRSGVALLKTAILASLGPTIRAALLDPDTGHSLLTIPDIIAYVVRRYGTATEQDILMLHAACATPFLADDTFDADAVRLDTLFRRLDRLGHPKSEMDKMEILQNATRHLVGTTANIGDYKRINNALQDRTFVSMTAYISSHHNNTVTVSAVGFVGKSVSVDMEERIKMGIAEGVRLALQELKLLKPENKSNKDSARDRKSKSRTAGLYCFVHGRCAHTGLNCFSMAADTKYTHQMKQATSASTLLSSTGQELIGA
jgi:hypothetical protein